MRDKIIYEMLWKGISDRMYEKTVFISDLNIYGMRQYRTRKQIIIYSLRKAM
jgi:hypothetical protein